MTRRPSRAVSAIPAILCALLVGASPSFGPGSGTLSAQSAGRAPTILELPHGARATGLGALQMAVSDPDNFRTHPALARRGGGMQLGMTRLGSGATAFSLATTTSWFGGSIGVGLALESLEYRGGTVGTRPGGIDPLFGSGDVGISETAAVLALATGFRGFDVGGSVRMTSIRADASRRSVTTMDVGIHRSIGPVRTALSARGIGRDFSLAGRTLKTPLGVVFGAGVFGQQFGPFDLGAAVEFGRRSDGEAIAGGGIEVAWWPVIGRTFTARAGVRNVPEGEAAPFSVGGSFRGDSFVLDWGWRPVSGTDGVHTVTIGWR